MLVTFKCSAFSNITMFGDVAEKLLKMMGQSGNVPGALLAEDIQSALKSLNQSLTTSVDEDLSPPPLSQDGDSNAAPIALSVRAKPLIDLLESAAAANVPVTWDA